MVNIPRSVRISLDALIDIAVNSRSGIPVAIKEIAKRQQVSLSYLEELVSALRSANLVQSIKGRKGGYLLTSAPEQISVTDVILALNPIRKRKIELAHLAKDLLESLEDCMKACFSSIKTDTATHYHIPCFTEAKKEPAYERLYESTSEAKVKPKLEVQRVFITKHKAVGDTLPAGPNSVFSFGQFLLNSQN